MSKRGKWVDLITGSDSQTAVKKLRQLDRRFQAWTNEQLSSDLFFGWALGYMVKGPIELSLAFLVTSVVTFTTYLISATLLTYDISTVQLLQTDVAFTAVVFTQGTHCELSNRIPSSPNQQADPSPEKSGSGSKEESPPEPSEIEA